MEHIPVKILLRLQSYSRPFQFLNFPATLPMVYLVLQRSVDRLSKTVQNFTIQTDQQGNDELTGSLRLGEIEALIAGFVEEDNHAIPPENARCRIV
jgi:hypothetical protein